MKKTKENIKDKSQSALEYLKELKKEKREDKIKRLTLIIDRKEEVLTIDNFTNLKELRISNIDTSGSKTTRVKTIKLINLPSLESVQITYCYIEELNIWDCPEIKTLILRDNELSNLDFLSNLSAEKLIQLNIIDNNIISKDLSPFSEFINLEILEVGNEEKEKGNEFNGSLKNLENLNKLTKLHISRTNINEGLRSLPNSIKEINCSGIFNHLDTSRWEIKPKRYDCFEIEEKLKTKTWRDSQYVEDWDCFSIESPSPLENILAKYKKEEKNEKLVLPQNILEKIIDFLKAKIIFINSRREIVEDLKEFYNKWDELITRKSDIVLEVGNLISDAEGAIPNTFIFGIPKALRESVKSGSFFSKMHFVGKGNEEFRIILSDSKDDLKELDRAQKELLSEINKSEYKEKFSAWKINYKNIEDNLKPFKDRHLIFEILNSSNLWKGKKHIKLEDLEAAIKSLNENLDQLEKEREKQFDKLEITSDLKDIIITELDLIVTRKKIFDLISLVGNKMKSKNRNLSERWRRDYERENMLERIIDPNLDIKSREEWMEWSKLKLLRENKINIEPIKIIWSKQDHLKEIEKKLSNLHYQQQSEYQQQNILIE